jgi:hypothetical protein
MVKIISSTASSLVTRQRLRKSENKNSSEAPFCVSLCGVLSIVLSGCVRFYHWTMGERGAEGREADRAGAGEKERKTGERRKKNRGEKTKGAEGRSRAPSRSHSHPYSPTE